MGRLGSVYADAKGTKLSFEHTTKTLGLPSHNGCGPEGWPDTSWATPQRGLPAPLPTARPAATRKHSAPHKREQRSAKTKRRRVHRPSSTGNILPKPSHSEVPGGSDEARFDQSMRRAVELGRKSGAAWLHFVEASKGSAAPGRKAPSSGPTSDQAKNDRTGHTGQAPNQAAGRSEPTAALVELVKGAIAGPGAQHLSHHTFRRHAHPRAC